MSSRIVAFTFIILLISTIIVYTMGDATMISLIKSVQDTQELLDAYNDGDYIKTGIKLIDIKLKVDPPEKGSREEKNLLYCRNQLVKIYPYYRKIHEVAKNKHSIKDVRNLKYEDIIEQAIDTLDSIIYEMGMAMDNLQHHGSILKLLESELQETNEDIPGNTIKDKNVNYPTEQLSNYLNTFSGQVANAFSQAVDNFAIEDAKEKFIVANHEINTIHNTGQSSTRKSNKTCPCGNNQNCKCRNKPNNSKASGGANENNNRIKHNVQ